MAEEFSVALADLGKGFEVVDRTHLKSILLEHKLSTTGLIDPQTARKLGQIAGVEALITGTITPFGDSIRLSVKILDTGTAKVIGASSKIKRGRFYLLEWEADLKSGRKQIGKRDGKIEPSPFLYVV